MLLLTDIGADIDDTEALLAVLGLPSLRLVGALTTVGDGVARGALTRGWLRLLNVPDGKVPIAPTVTADNVACVAPGGFPAPEDAALLPLGSAAQLVLDLAREHAGRLIVLCNAPLTPLAQALQADEHGVLRKGLKRLYVQGNVRVDAATGWMEPDAQAYNLRRDMEAAATVFSELQASVPFTILGKFAAYRVGVTQADLRGLERPAEPLLPSVLTAAREQMNAFRGGNPELFYKLYPIPDAAKTDEDWYEYLPGDVISHPYDPLVVLLAAADAAGSARGRGKAGSMFEQLEVSGGHKLVGNTQEQHGVPNPELVRGALVRSMEAALDRLQLPSEDTVQ